MRIVFIVALSSLLCVNSSSAAEKWSDGVIVLKDNQVLVGEVLYNPEYEAIQIKSDDKIQTFSAFLVRSFNFYDNSNKILRRFISQKYTQHPGYSLDQFFEIIISDEISLWRKKSNYVNSSVRSNDKYDQKPEQIRDYDFYFSYKGKIVKSEKFKKELRPLINVTLKNEIDGFIKENGLSQFRTYDQIVIVRFFNKISGSQEKKLLTSN